jgi:hypothetical protein
MAMDLKLPELRAAGSFLQQARLLVSGVGSLFFNAGEKVTAARLNDIDIRLGDEVDHVDRLISQAEASKQ